MDGREGAPARTPAIPFRESGGPPRELIGRRLFDAFPFPRSYEIHRGDEAREQLAVREGKTYAANTLPSNLGVEIEAIFELGD